ncbi:virulence factor SrfB, partial [Desulfovibrio sp. 1188_IL3213]|uniref:virulence factor SrfB n=2 Tax=unclassified Desulfovibrio TaxID=2593640 RepID=UPI002FDA1822
MNVIPRYLSPVSIIPGGCPQFLDFALQEESIRRLRRYFREEKKNQGDADGRYTHYLRCLAETESGFIDQLTGQPCDEDYSVEARRAVEVWEGHWLPIPFLRTLDQAWPDGGKRFECGPSNWARA